MMSKLKFVVPVKLFWNAKAWQARLNLKFFYFNEVSPHGFLPQYPTINTEYYPQVPCRLLKNQSDKNTRFWAEKIAPAHTSFVIFGETKTILNDPPGFTFTGREHMWIFLFPKLERTSDGPRFANASLNELKDIPKTKSKGA